MTSFIVTDGQDLDGEVFPKLNWSAPRDATWVNVGENTRSLLCAMAWGVEVSEFHLYQVHESSGDYLTSKEQRLDSARYLSCLRLLRRRAGE